MVPCSLASAFLPVRWSVRTLISYIYFIWVLIFSMPHWLAWRIPGLGPQPYDIRNIKSSSSMSLRCREKVPCLTLSLLTYRELLCQCHKPTKKQKTEPLEVIIVYETTSPSRKRTERTSQYLKVFVDQPPTAIPWLCVFIVISPSKAGQPESGIFHAI